jgi:hypothetical protein
MSDELHGEWGLLYKHEILECESRSHLTRENQETPREFLCRNILQSETEMGGYQIKFNEIPLDNENQCGSRLLLSILNLQVLIPKIYCNDISNATGSTQKILYYTLLPAITMCDARHLFTEIDEIC